MNTKEIMKKASKVLKGKWILTIIAVVLFNTIISVPSGIASVLSTFFYVIKYGEDVPTMAVYTSPFNLISLLIYVLYALLMVGYLRMTFKIVQEDKVDLGMLFSGCKYWLKALGIMLLTGLYTLLWSLLFIVPGIIKSLSYSMALYIYAKNPEKGVKQCISESVELMNGNKKKFFVLNFKYVLLVLGVYLLSAAPFIIFIFVDKIGYIILSLFWFMLVLGILCTILFVHQQIAHTVFYLDLIDELDLDKVEVVNTDNTNNVDNEVVQIES